jgi:tetratricopeptide (TPR) repeat protein
MILSQAYKFVTNQAEQPPVNFLYSFLVFNSNTNAKLTQDERNLFYETLIDLIRSYGEALVGSKEHIRAREYLKQAREMIRHQHLKNEQFQNHEHYAPISELIADCLIAVNDINNAVLMLEGVADKSVSVAMKLGKLYQKKGNEQGAIECFQHVLRRDRYVLTAVETLIELGLPETQKKDLKGMYNTTQDEWICRWIDTKFELVQKNNYKDSISALDRLQQIPQLQQPITNLYSLLDTAYCRFMLHENDRALELFERACKLDEYNVYRMDTFARLLSSSTAPLLITSLRQQSRLSTLARTVAQHNPKAPETQLVLAIYYYQNSMKGTDEQQQKQQQQLALKLVNRAIRKYESRCFTKYEEGLLVKAEILISTARYDEAVLCYHSLHVFSKDLRIYEGLVRCYLSIPQYKDAYAAASMALKLYPNNPHAQILMGSVMLTKQEMLPKAKSHFEKAIQMVTGSSMSIGDSFALERATVGLADYYCKNQQYPEAIKVLMDQLKRSDSDLVHCKLGDAYMLSGPTSYDIALSHYHTALSKNPTNIQAREGLTNLERVLHPTEDTGQEELEDEVEDDLEDVDQSL